MRRAFTTIFTLTFLALGVAAWRLPLKSATVTEAPAVVQTQLRRQAIAFHERRLTEDPESALDMAQLAALSLEDGRMSGDERAFVKAESLARRSLRERARKNGRSAALLANALLAQHRFAEAHHVARELVEREPDEPAYRALLAETLMEVGDYVQAIGQLGAVRERRGDLGIAPRFARWAELTGQTAEARRILRQAREDAASRPDLTAEQRAWFGLRLADLELRHGNLRSAAAVIKESLREAPDDWRLILTRARLEAAQGSWRKAARSAEDVIATVPSPDAFALLATAQRELGNVAEAEALELALEGIVASQSGMIHRSWALAMLDRERNIDQVIALATADTLVRHDIHSLDLLAWSLHRGGWSTGALSLTRRAMSQGSTEPMLRYHAGMIELAVGDTAMARHHLSLALGHAHALSPAQAGEIRRALATRRN
jgi:tetratricopeptide (TPR) repeat protein